MLVGEQPGDQEDLEGHPFVGPAGALLDQALDEAGIDRTDGLRHQRGQALQVGGPGQAAHPPEAERGRGRRLPAVAGRRDRGGAARGSSSALGAVAAQALLGEQFRVTKQRGELFEQAGRAGAHRHRPPLVDPAGARRRRPAPGDGGLRRRPARGGQEGWPRSPGNIRPHAGGQPQGHHRRVRRQRGHRRRQVRRLPPHRARRRCWPRRCTRSPTPATRACSSSAATGPGRRPRPTTPSATGGSATSGRSSWPSSSSAWARCSPSTRAIEKLRHPHELESVPHRRRHPAGGHRPRDVLVAHRDQGEQPRPGRPGRGGVHPPVEGPRAAGRPARGHRRRGRPRPRPGRRGPGRDHRQPPLRRGRQHRHRHPAGA